MDEYKLNEQTSKQKPIYGLEISEANKRLWVGEINNGIVTKTLYTDTWGGNRMKGTREQIIDDAELIVKALNVYVEASKREQLNDDGLFPCPFCREFTTLKYELDENDESIYAVEHECSVYITTGWDHDKQAVIDAWNRRA